MSIDWQSITFHVRSLMLCKFNAAPGRSFVRSFVSSRPNVSAVWIHVRQFKGLQVG